MGISQNSAARAIGVPPRVIHEIVLGKRSITPAMSIRFGAFFSHSDVSVVPSALHRHLLGRIHRRHSLRVYDTYDVRLPYGPACCREL